MDHLGLSSRSSSQVRMFWMCALLALICQSLPTPPIMGRWNPMSMTASTKKLTMSRSSVLDIPLPMFRTQLSAVAGYLAVRFFRMEKVLEMSFLRFHCFSFTISQLRVRLMSLRDSS